MALLTALLAWLRTLLPYLYDGALFFAGKEWQEKIDEAKESKRQADTLTKTAQESNAVDRLVAHGELDRLRNFWDEGKPH